MDPNQPQNNLTAPPFLQSQGSGGLSSDHNSPGLPPDVEPPSNNHPIFTADSDHPNLFTADPDHPVFSTGSNIRWFCSICDSEVRNLSLCCECGQEEINKVREKMIAERKDLLKYQRMLTEAVSAHMEKTEAIAKKRRENFEKQLRMHKMKKEILERRKRVNDLKVKIEEQKANMKERVGHKETLDKALERCMKAKERDVARDQANPFHSNRELQAASQALQQERRRRCQELASFYPLKRITSDNVQNTSSASSSSSSGANTTNNTSTSTPSVVILGQVRDLDIAAGTMLPEEDIINVAEAITHLVTMLKFLAIYLDVSLPFPVQLPTFRERRLTPGILRPTTANNLMINEMGQRSGYIPFSIYDNIVTKEYQLGISLLTQDMRVLASRVAGAYEQAGAINGNKNGLLLLLVALLNSPDLGALKANADTSKIHEAAFQPAANDPEDWMMLENDNIIGF